MRICFWPTTFQADILALAYHLADRGDHEVTVALERPRAFSAEVLARLWPLRAAIVERGGREALRRLERADFDLLVVDNHLPPRALAPHLLVAWHGFGWRHDDLSSMRRQLRSLVGDVERPNPGFRWLALGAWDRDYRVRRSKLARDNVVTAGAPYSDWLLPHSPQRRQVRVRDVQGAYRVDLGAPVVLLGLTWHHGGALGHWGPEERLLGQLLEHVAARGAVTLIRAHDRHRYHPAYVALLERAAGRVGDRAQLKFKSDHPDTTVDLLVSDVLVSNYSSLLNAYYYTGRPSVHIDPHDARRVLQPSYTMRYGVPLAEHVAPAQLWKLPPEEHGGLRASSFEALLAAIDRALEDAACCQARSRRFVERYVHRADGGSCARVSAWLDTWLG